MKRLLAVLALAFSAGGCGYRLANHADALPAKIQTISIPAFGNNTTQYRLADLVSKAVTREMIQRTRYRILAGDQKDADAVLTGAMVNFVSYPTTFDQNTGRASGVQMIAQFRITLRDRDGKVLYNRPFFEVRERYEISVDPKTYFDEGSVALERVSRDVARSIVSGILENF